MMISLGRTVAALAGCGKTIVARWTFKGPRVWGNGRIPGRMLKKFVQQGRSTRRGDAYSVRYVEPLNKARTKLADFFSILLEKGNGLGDHFVVQARERLISPSVIRFTTHY
jgi:hypothetical protein